MSMILKKLFSNEADDLIDKIPMNGRAFILCKYNNTISIIVCKLNVGMQNHECWYITDNGAGKE